MSATRAPCVSMARRPCEAPERPALQGALSARTAPSVAVQRASARQAVADQPAELRGVAKGLEVGIVLDVAVLAEAEGQALGQLAQRGLAFALHGVQPRRLH